MDRNRFCQLWMRNLNPNVTVNAEPVFDLLAANYSHSLRSYHDGQHIEDCLAWLDGYRGQVEDPDAIELAIWFHDACYSPDPVGHEQRGADLLRQLAGNKMDAQRLDKVCSMILHTTHQQAPLDPEQALVLDIDLASFARPWPAYLRDTARCRAEMRQLPDVEYCACQLGFLRQLLGREQIYYHPRFNADHEADARSNINRLIELLEARSGRVKTPAARVELSTSK
ncbi:MAG: hypothetical protein V7752_19015 [Halopseudomonas sp.]